MDTGQLSQNETITTDKKTGLSFVTIAILLFVIGIVLAIIVVSMLGGNTPSNEYRVVVPEGTGDLIEAGENPEIIPAVIELKIGENNILVIENQDSTDHAVGPFFVRAGETIRQEFTKPNVYQGACTIHPDAQVEIVVTE